MDEKIVTVDIPPPNFEKNEEEKKQQLVRNILRVPTVFNVKAPKKLLLKKFSRAELNCSSKYSSNSEKENAILEYVENFRRQFVQIFPERASNLLFCAKNECGTMKFVCTTIRPTRLPYVQNYNLESCAEFVSEYLDFISLGDPLSFPDLLYSPTLLLKLREGDCLDFSNFAVCLLRGYGFDAYVVSGYAPFCITIRDQSQDECPIGRNYEFIYKLDSKEEGNGEKKNSSVEEKKYEVNRPKPHVSKFMQMLEERGDKEPDFEEENVGNNTGAYEKEDQFAGSRCHCWVLIKKGWRDVAQDLFLEPSTGRIYRISESPYYGIESVWNESNYWVNLQSVPSQKMDYNLKDNKKWEYLLINEKIEGNTEEEQMFDTEDTKKVNPSEANIAKEMHEMNLDTLDAGISWVLPIEISRENFQARYPGGIKKTEYKKCVVEKMSKFVSESDGMDMRVSKYADEELKDPIEIEEFFSRRTDKLWKRTIFPKMNKVHSEFEPGRQRGLKDLIEIEEEKRYFEFYSNSRVDGMIKREEVLGVKISEMFENRDDFLIYRSISFDSASQFVGRRQKGFTMSFNGNQEQPIRKITEKFARNPDLKAESDVRKRTHFIAKGEIRLDYHYGENRITSSYEMFIKQTETVVEERVDPQWPKRTKKDVALKFRELIAIEKGFMSLIKDREREIQNILADLKREQSDVVKKSVYDIAQEQSNEVQEKGFNSDSKSNESQMDYLSPFLAQYPNGKALTRKQAIQARDECLKALKNRLLQRDYIIQSHLDVEQEKLKQRQAIYNRSNSSGEVDEEFAKFYEETMFRISILQARLERHEEMAFKKYAELEERLKNDPRLQILSQ